MLRFIQYNQIMWKNDSIRFECYELAFAAEDIIDINNWKTSSKNTLGASTGAVFLSFEICRKAYFRYRSGAPCLCVWCRRTLLQNEAVKHLDRNSNVMWLELQRCTITVTQGFLKGQICLMNNKRPKWAMSMAISLSSCFKFQTLY